MKKTTFFIIIISCLATSWGQDQKKLSATLAFPFSIDSEFTGLADIGLQYRLVKLGPVTIGASTSFNILSNSTETESLTIKTNVLLFQPRIFGELNFYRLEKLKPFLGVGYSWGIFKTEFENANNEKNEGGINAHIGVAFDFTDRFFVHMQLDNTWITREKPSAAWFSFGRIETTQTLTLFKVGLGFRL